MSCQCYDYAYNRADDFSGGQILSLLRQDSCGAASAAQMTAVFDTVRGVNFSPFSQTRGIASSSSETSSVGEGNSVFSDTGLKRSGSVGTLSAVAMPTACSETSGLGS